MTFPHTPLFFEPNLRHEKAHATSGYTWGKTVGSSKILENLPSDSREKTRKLFEEGDIISERWMCSDDPANGSIVLTEAGSTSLRELLDTHSEEMLGAEHIQHFGAYLGCIMKQLDTNEQKDVGGLSVQVHPRNGHPTRPTKPEMWKGEGAVYLGWKEDMTPDMIRKIYELAGNGSDLIKNSSGFEELMNSMQLTKDMHILVHGGLIHAIRANSFLSEWSKAPNKIDIAKGNLAQATVALWDRTDGKTPRPGKEDLPGTLEVMENADTFKKSRIEDLCTTSHTVYEDQEGNMLRKLFITPEVHVDELELTSSFSLSLQDGGLPWYLEKGALEIIQNGKVLCQVQAGSEFFLPYSLKNIVFKSSDDAPAVLQTWYAPLTISGRQLAI